MNYLDKFIDVKTFIFDVDGVFTDNAVLMTENGELLRRFNVRDGFAVKYALKLGYRIAIITGGKSIGVALRFRDLGVKDIFSGVEDKKSAFEAYIKRENIDSDEILFMGDDLLDVQPLCLVGLPACPADACPEVKAVAQYISPYKGGGGCVRDVISKVLALHDNWPPFKNLEEPDNPPT